MAMTAIDVRPMTSPEFATMRERLIESYAAHRMTAGDWAPQDARRRAAEVIDALLAEGLDTPGMLLLVGEHGGEVVGRAWVALTGRDGSGAWLYDIEVDADHRGRGLGRGLLQAVEREAARHGASSLGLNVFADNEPARRLYETAGYAPTSLRMRKPLAAAGP